MYNTMNITLSNRGIVILPVLQDLSSEGLSLCHTSGSGSVVN